MTSLLLRWAVPAALVAVFVFVRLPYVLHDAVLLGWNSDAAVFGLMAKRIAEEGELPIFFWGQSYMGPLTAFVAAGIGLLLPDGHWPLALRLATWLECLAAIAFSWLALRIAFDRVTATVVALLLAIGTVELLRFNVAPIGAEQAFLLGSILLWYAVGALARGGFRPRDWLIFGALCGFGSWINQTTLFVAAALLLVTFLSSEFWAVAWPEPRIVDRLLLRRLDRLGWRELDPATRILVRAIGCALIVAFVLGVLRAFSPSVPAFFLHSPALEPLMALLLFHLVAELLFGTRLRAALRHHLAPRNAALFLLGALIAYSPALIAGLLAPHPLGAGWSAPAERLTAIPAKIALIARHDFWQFAGAEKTPLGIAYAIVLVAALLVAVVRHRGGIADMLRARARQYGPKALCGAVILIALVFYVASSRALHGGSRFIIVALAPLWAFAFEGKRRVAAVVAAAALAVAAIGHADRVKTQRDAAIGWSWVYPERIDPRPLLATMERGRYTVCYADYWLAYKLQFLSDERVRFIPFAAVDRRPDVSRRYAALPGRRCFVEKDGTVRDYRPADSAIISRIPPWP